ncbi:MAG TPA: Trp family transcriptional regulator, partial [Gammaproteobacteria bacterium]|nr:Trp family transcriptional regulator [Gammaproteobacteria bacterium]
MKVNRNFSKESGQLLQDLCEAIALIKTKDEAFQFFEDLCTPAELEAMADRFRLVALIKAGIPYRQI